MTIAYHASHEQYPPSELLKYAVLAEKAGFNAIHSSDHFHPWSVRQGNSGYSFSWIAAAMQATTIPFSMVCAPGQRYHPAIVAQAIATLGEMFPGRYSIELGSGEALNEVITGENWPSKEIRNERLLQSATIIRDLLSGKEVSFKGHVQIKEAKLYSLPSVMPPLFCAAISKETSEWAGGWSDGLLTTGGEPKEVMEKKEAFCRHAGNKPVFIQHSFAFGNNREDAITGAHEQWRTNLLPSQKLADFYKPEHFDKKAAAISREEVEEKIKIITSIDELHTIVEQYRKIGVNRVILHNVNRNQQEFIQAFKDFYI